MKASIDDIKATHKGCQVLRADVTLGGRGGMAAAGKREESVRDNRSRPTPGTVVHRYQLVCL
jgi:hypothetical protein